MLSVASDHFNMCSLDAYTSQRAGRLHRGRKVRTIRLAPYTRIFIDACNQLMSRGEMKEAPRCDSFESRLKRLWMRAQDGDESAYRASLATITVRLRAYFGRRLSKVPDEVEDLIQETLLALHLHRGTYSSDIPVSAWVYAIARHKLIDLLRRRGRREALHDSFDELDDAVHPFEYGDQQAQRDLVSLMKLLPQLQQQAIFLIKIEGLTAVEASRRTGISVSALKVQVHRGLKRLAKVVREVG